jgi:hypothetical protein
MFSWISDFFWVNHEHSCRVINNECSILEFQYEIHEILTIFYENSRMMLEFSFFYFTRYWIISIFSYFLILFFRIFSSSNDFLIEISSFMLIETKFVNLIQLKKSKSSSTDSSWAIKTIEWIRELLEELTHKRHCRLFAWLSMSLHVNSITWDFLSLITNIRDVIADISYRRC